MTAPGPLNALSDVPGLQVGHAEDAAARTGVTVIRFNAPMRCAVDLRGGGTATRETGAVSVEATLGIAHAVTLSGGSVFGLAAADEVAAVLSAEGIGYCPLPGTPPVPIVPAASLYDLGNGGGKAWRDTPPYRALARAALADTRGTGCGSLGAGYGAVAGAWLGGLGTASLVMEQGTVAALVAVNAIGSPVMPDGKTLWAWPFERDGEYGGRVPEADAWAGDPLPADIKGGTATPATCIGIVASSVPLDRTALNRIAIMAQDGLARAIRPSHAPFDGDTLFAVCPDESAPPDPALTMRLGSAAADCVARAVGRALWHADAATDRVPAFRNAPV